MRRWTWLAAALAPSAVAQVPGVVGYQGRLLKVDGTPEAGVVAMTFSIFPIAIGGAATWSEDQQVALSDGFYSVLLGSVKPFPATLWDGNVRWLEVSVSASALSPRQKIGSVPYAVRSGTSQNVAGGGTVDAATATFSGGVKVGASTAACTAALAGTLRFDAAGAVLSVCDGQAWQPVGATKGGDGTSAASAATSCKAILDAGFSTGSGAYWLKPTPASTPFQVYCDMTTQGGGWTLAMKLRGNSNVLNRNDAQWLKATITGNTTNLNAEDALGPAYLDVTFSDVMIRSLANANKNLGWHHTRPLSNLWDVVRAQTPISDGALLFGSVSNLDYSGAATCHNDCPDLRYGFYGFDYHYRFTTFPGRFRTTGHVGGIVAASRFEITDLYGGAGGAATAHPKNCISDFGFGGGYYDMVGVTSQYNINAHWWGAGNSCSADFAAHGLFLR